MRRQLFAQKIAHAVDRLGEEHAVGQHYRSSTVEGVRRLLRPRTRYHVYYVVEHARKPRSFSPSGVRFAKIHPSMRARITYGAFTDAAHRIDDAFLASMRIVPPTSP